MIQKPNLHTLCHIGPIIVGFIMGFSWFWVRGEAFVYQAPPEGYSWSRYIVSAWGLQDPQAGLYNPFLDPGYYWLLSEFGNMIGSYRDAGVLISSVSVVVLLLSTGGVGYFFGGTWASMCSMMVLPWVANTVDSARWINSYPLQSAVCSVMVCSWLYSTKYAAKGWIILGSMSIVLACAVDQRAVFFIPCCVLLGGWVIYKHTICRLRTMMLAVVALVFSFWILHAVLPNPRRLSFAERHAEQQQVTRRWQIAAGISLREACTELPRQDVLTLTAALGTCGRATLVFNWQHRFPSYLPFGSTLMVSFFLLGILGRKNRMEFFLFFGGMGVPLVLWASWTPFPERYVLLYAMPFATMVPASLGKLFASHHEGVRSFVFLILVVGAWNADFCGRDGPTERSLDREDVLMHTIMAHLRTKLAPDALFLDCTRNKLEALYVPHTNHMQLLRNGRLESYCPTYIQEKDSRDRWIVLEEGGHIYPSHNGWTEDKRWGKTILWFQQGKDRPLSTE